MLFRILTGFIGLAVLSVGAADAPKDYQATANRLIHSATNSTFGFNRLATMCDTFGPRFSGSPNLEKAIDWCLAQMKKDGFVNVHGEEVTVPHWVRGRESATLLKPRARAAHDGSGRQRGYTKEGYHGRSAGGRKF